MKYFFIVAWRYIIGQKPPPVQRRSSLNTGDVLVDIFKYDETIKVKLTHMVWMTPKCNQNPNNIK